MIPACDSLHVVKSSNCESGRLVMADRIFSKRTESLQMAERAPVQADRILPDGTESLQTEEQTLVQADGILNVDEGAAEQPAGYK